MNLLVQIRDARHLARFARALVTRGDMVHTAESVEQLGNVARNVDFDAVILEWTPEGVAWVGEQAADRPVAYLTQRSQIHEVVGAHPEAAVLPLPGTALAARCALSPDPARDPACRLGDYQLVDIQALGRRTHIFQARQVSIDRPVILRLLNQEHEDDQAALEDFLGDARAKAAVSHERIGTVYQALEQPPWIFYTAEMMDGPTLADLADQGRKLAPAAALDLIRSLASALLHLETRQLAANPFELRHIHFANDEASGLARFSNQAVTGTPEPHHHASHFLHTLSLIRDHLDNGQPEGESICQWTDLLLQQPADTLPLSQVISEARSRRNQAGEPETPSEAAQEPPRFSRTLAALVALVVGAVMVSVALKISQQTEDGDTLPDAPPLRDADGMVVFKGGAFDHPTQGKIEVATFSLAKYEVTIRQYAAFLEALRRGNPDRYDHPAQPKGKQGHEPRDWQAMLAAANTGEAYQGFLLRLDCPVFNIDWFDAFAYAKWAGRRLPTAEEWEFAAGVKDGRKFPWAGEWDPARANAAQRPNSLFGHEAWCPVNVPEGDVTPEGVHNLAGNVSEWTASQQIHPEFPDRTIPVVKGGSFASSSPITGDSRRLPVFTRDVREPWLGFRTAMNSRESP